MKEIIKNNITKIKQDLEKHDDMKFLLKKEDENIIDILINWYLSAKKTKTHNTKFIIEKILDNYF